LDKFIALFASGITIGAIMAIVALGFLVLYKATGIVNFAHGELVTLGSYFGLWAISTIGLPIIPGYLLALVLMFGGGVVLERVAYAPLRKRPVLIVVIATLAASIVIGGLLALWQGNTPQTLASPVGTGSFTVDGAHISYQQVLVVAVCAVIVVVLLYVFQRTNFGRQVRALASDREMAELVGVRSRAISIFAFGISAVLAGIAGLLIAPLTAVDLTFGFTAMITAFTAAVIGGFGSLPGVVLGGLFIGLLQQVVGGYLVPNYSETLPFIALFIVIVVRPQGLTRAVGRARL
jgi:branched-chain amino acid transport system permease protein